MSKPNLKVVRICPADRYRVEVWVPVWDSGLERSEWQKTGLSAGDPMNAIRMAEQAATARGRKTRVVDTLADFETNKPITEREIPA